MSSSRKSRVILGTPPLLFSDQAAGVVAVKFVHLIVVVQLKIANP